MFRNKIQSFVVFLILVLSGGLILANKVQAQDNKKRSKIDTNRFADKSFRISEHDIELNLGGEYTQFNPNNALKLDMANVRASILINVLAQKELLSSLKYYQGKNKDELYVLLDTLTKGEQMFRMQLNTNSVVDSTTILLNKICETLINVYSLKPTGFQVNTLKNYKGLFVKLGNLHKLVKYNSDNTINSQYMKFIRDTDKFINDNILVQRKNPIQFATFVKGYYMDKRNELLFGSKYYNMNELEYAMVNTNMKKNKSLKITHISELEKLVINFHVLYSSNYDF